MQSTEHIQAGRKSTEDDPLAPGPGSALERFRGFGQRQLEKALTPLARPLSRLGVTPNQVSISGVVLNSAAALLILTGNLALAGAVYLVAGVLDLLDGVLARLTSGASRFGAFLDSTLDRVSEGVVFAALAYWFATAGSAFDAGLVVLALLGSFLVSYVRARAEGLGAECKVGIVTRAERVVLMAFGLLTGYLAEVIYVLIALTAITVVQRILHVSRQLTLKH